MHHAGAHPVIVDVEPDTLNMDPAAVARALTPRTRAVMPVYLHGHPADLDPLLALAKQHGLVVSEDAAHALPARYKGRMVGAIGLRQLEKLQAFHARRVALARTYTAAFADLPQAQAPVERADVESAWHLDALRLNLDQLTIDRSRFIEIGRAHV